MYTNNNGLRHNHVLTHKYEITKSYVQYKFNTRIFTVNISNPYNHDQMLIYSKAYENLQK